MEEFELGDSSFEDICNLLLTKTLKFDDRPTIKLTIDREGEQREVELKRIKLL